jgi:hypothetical protein
MGAAGRRFKRILLLARGWDTDDADPCGLRFLHIFTNAEIMKANSDCSLVVYAYSVFVSFVKSLCSLCLSPLKQVKALKINTL